MQVVRPKEEGHGEEGGAKRERERNYMYSRQPEPVG